MRYPHMVPLLLAAMAMFQSAANVSGARVNHYSRQNDESITCVTAGFFSHPTDCSQFYRCVDFFGTGQEFTIFFFNCPYGTIFDEGLSVCNFPEWVLPPPPCMAGSGSVPAPTEKPDDSTLDPTTDDSLTAISNTDASTTDESIATQSPATSGAPSTETVTETVPVTNAPITGQPTPPTFSSSTAIIDGGEETSEGPEVSATDSPSTTLVPDSSESSQVTDGTTTASTNSESSESVIVESASPSASLPPGTTPSSTAAPTGTPSTILESTDSSTTESSSAESAASSTTISTEGQSTDPSTTESSATVSSTDSNGTPSSILESTDSGSTESSATTTTVDPNGTPTESTEAVTEGTTTSSQAATVPAGEGTTEGVTSATDVTSTESPEAQLVQFPESLPSSAFTLKCGDDQFHRHPLRCDLFYQCIWSGSFNINILACPIGNVFDEPSSKCLPPDQTAPCGSSASNSTTVTTSNPTEDVSSTTAPSIQYSVAPGSVYACSRPGHFPYELDCIRFYRCFEVEPGVLKGLLYRCPDGYGYDAKVSQRCQKEKTTPNVCDRSNVVRVGSIPIPMIPLDDTTAVRVEDLNSFFANANSFYYPRG